MCGDLTGRERLVDAATELFRRRGFAAASVEEICSQAGLSKGAFFHHFESKEAVALAALRAWDELAADWIEASRVAGGDAIDQVVGAMTFVIDLFSVPGTLKSCLAGNAAQEMSASHPAIRESANMCLANARDRFQRLLEDAGRQSGVSCDFRALATLWMASIQGSLVLFKASGDESVIRTCLGQVRSYIECLLRGGEEARAWEEE